MKPLLCLLALTSAVFVVPAATAGPPVHCSPLGNVPPVQTSCTVGTGAATCSFFVDSSGLPPSPGSPDWGGIGCPAIYPVEDLVFGIVFHALDCVTGLEPVFRCIEPA